MKKVYVVLWVIPYEGSDLKGVYKTEKGANDAVEAF